MIGIIKIYQESFIVMVRSIYYDMCGDLFHNGRVNYLKNNKISNTINKIT